MSVKVSGQELNLGNDKCFRMGQEQNKKANFGARMEASEQAE